MPVAILRPNGLGAHAEWSLNGAATAVEAVAALDDSFLLAPLTALRHRFTYENLPADAATVTSLLAYGQCSGSASMRWTLDLAGTESNGAPFDLPDGGYQVFSTAFATAPGGLSWTVARVNAVTGGPDALGVPSTEYLVNEHWLYVEYETAAGEDERGGPKRIPLSRSGGAPVRLGHTETAHAFLDRTGARRIELNRTRGVDMPLRRTLPVRLDLESTED